MSITNELLRQNDVQRIDVLFIFAAKDESSNNLMIHKLCTNL